MNGIAEC